MCFELRAGQGKCCANSAQKYATKYKQAKATARQLEKPITKAKILLLLGFLAKQAGRQAGSLCSAKPATLQAEQELGDSSSSS